jgi:UPF0716 protein FxsA
MARSDSGCRPAKPQYANRSTRSRVARRLASARPSDGLELLHRPSPYSPDGALADGLTDGRSTLKSRSFFFGALLFVTAEIAAFVVVAEQIGFLWALAMLVVVSALGPFVVRRVGVGALVHTEERLARGEVPARDLVDGLVILSGGAMICVPGFIGDAVGLLLMIGPLRHLLIRAAGRGLARRVQTIHIGSRVIDTTSRATRDDSSPPAGPYRALVGSGDGTGA